MFNPIWLIPPAIAALLNLRLALSMHDKSASDLLYAALFLPAELYMWVRMGHFLSAWTQFFARSEKDNWAAQANAEKGRGSAYVFPLVVRARRPGWSDLAWSQQSLVNVQSAMLSLGWPVLYLVTVAADRLHAAKLVASPPRLHRLRFPSRPGRSRSAGPAACYRPSSLSPGWSSGRRPSGQWYLRSASAIGRSLMLASRRRIRPSSSNSQFSLPYERNQLPRVVVPLVGEADGDPVIVNAHSSLISR